MPHDCDLGVTVLAAAGSRADAGAMILARFSLIAAALIAAAPASARTWDAGRFDLMKRMAYWRVRGASVAVVDGCRVVESRGFGTANAAGVPVTPRTLFQAASISKSVTAVAALRLVEAGKLSLDADVREALREWTLPGEEPVTLRALLTHTAGVGVPGFPGYPVGVPLPRLPAILDGLPPAASPAVRVDGPAGAWRYSGGGYEIVEALIEDTGEPFASLAARLVLSPAGMTDSAFDQPLAAARESVAATGFDATGAPLPGGARVYPELAAAGLWTSPSDVARFAIAVARSIRGEGGLLTKTSADVMLTRAPGDWGLGVDLGSAGTTPHFGHTGSNAGFTSAFVLYPDRCVGAVVMTNGEAPELVTETLDAIADAFRWPDRSPAPQPR